MKIDDERRFSFRHKTKDLFFTNSILKIGTVIIPIYLFDFLLDEFLKDGVFQDKNYKSH